MWRLKESCFQIRALIAVGAMLAVPVAALAQGTLFVEGDNVGIGTPSPNVKLHVTGEGTARVRVEDSSGSTGPRQLFEVINNGRPQFEFFDTSFAESWFFEVQGFAQSFVISRRGTGIAEAMIDGSGNLTIAGVLSQGSSRESKHQLETVDHRSVLQRVAALPLYEWSYKADSPNTRHLGPMAEDFGASFGLGGSSTHIGALDVAGVALAAIQALHVEVVDRDHRIQQLIEHTSALARQVDALVRELEILKKEDLTSP